MVAEDATIILIVLVFISIRSDGNKNQLPGIMAFYTCKGYTLTVSLGTDAIDCSTKRKGGGVESGKRHS